MAFLYPEQLDPARSLAVLAYKQEESPAAMRLGEKGFGNPLFEDTGPPHG